MDDGAGLRISDPISELRSLLRAATGWKLADAALQEEIADLQGRVRDMTRRDPGWRDVYARAVGAARALLTAAAPAGGAPSPAPAALDPRVLDQLINSAKRAISQSQGAWPGRLSTQVKNDFMPKIERSVESLTIVSNADSKTGQTTYQVNPVELEQFFAWLAELERSWAAHNAELVATRANEAIAMVLAGQRLDFSVQPARINPPPPPVPGRPRFEGHTIDTPKALALLGTGYRMVMTAAGAVTGLGFLAARFDIGTALKTILPPVMGLVLLVTLVTAIVTIPRQRRQGLARLERDARSKVHAAVIQALTRRLQDFESSQMNDIRRHLSDEEMRLSALANAVRVAAPPPVAAGASGAPRIAERDLAEVRDRWLPALQERLAQLSAV